MLEPLTYGEASEFFRWSERSLRHYFVLNGGGCGIHVHLDLAAVGSVPDIMRLINFNRSIYEVDQDLYVAIYGRLPNQFCLLSIEQRRIEYGAVQVYRGNYREFARSATRYNAISITPHRTVEFRGFMSYLDAGWMADRLQIIEMMVSASKNFPIKKSPKTERGEAFDVGLIAEFKRHLISEKLIVIQEENDEQ